MKHFFENQDSERCYSKDHFIDEMKERGLSEMSVYPAKMIKNESFAFCTEADECIEVKTGDCGKSCGWYSPRNGKNGRCRYSHNCYESGDDPIILRLKK